MKTRTSRGSQWGTLVMAVCGVFVAGMLAAASLLAEPVTTVQVSVGEGVTVPAENVTKLAIAEPAVADVVPLSDKEISVIGKKVGVTTLTVVRSEGRPTQVYRIEVGNDAAAATIRQVIGSPNITVRAIGDTLVLDGQVNDELEAQRAVQVASAYKAQVVNLLEVSKPRQIKIRMRVAEVNSEAVKNVGFQWFGPQGQVEYAMSFIGGGSIIHGLIPTASEFGTAGSTIVPNAVSLTVLVDLLITKGYARLLSEPTLVTFSGKEASFLVGQEVPIVQQLPQSFTVEFKQVGVRMKIKPTADSQNRINTTIHAEVSQISGASVNGIPIIASKTADTTLQVNDGQTVVIGGLLENNISRDLLRKVPWIAEIPVLGALFRDKQFDQVQREVLFFMTPEVIKDINADTAIAPRTPIMKEWHGKRADKSVLEIPKHNDWGLQIVDEQQPDDRGRKAKESKKPEPNSNFEPARPATN